MKRLANTGLGTFLLMKKVIIFLTQMSLFNQFIFLDIPIKPAEDCILRAKNIPQFQIETVAKVNFKSKNKKFKIFALAI